MDVYVNIQKRGNSILLATCDSDLLGKCLKDGNVIFDIREDFYKGSKISIEEAITLMQKSTIVNMVGHNIVKKAIDIGLIHPEAVLKISGIPHAQIVKM